MSHHGGVILDGRARLAQPVRRGTFDLLDEIATILGTTKNAFWPFLESTGDRLVEIATGDRDLRSRDESGPVFLESEFSPYQHEGGVHSYYFDVAGNQHFQGGSGAAFSFVDHALSVGCWCLALDLTSVALVAKWNFASPATREWVVWINASNKFEYREYDESVNAEIKRPSSASIVKGVWTFCVGTNNGGNDKDNINVYLNGSLDNGTAAESGTFVKMEALSVPVSIGALNLTTTISNEFNGRIALPFVTGKELSDSEVGRIYQIGRELLGV